LEKKNYYTGLDKKKGKEFISSNSKGKVYKYSQEEGNND